MQRTTIIRLPVVVVGRDASQRQHAAPQLPWQRHAARARQGEPLLISAVPGNQRVQGIAIPHWRDALKALR